MNNARNRCGARPATRTGAVTIALCFMVATFEGIDLQAPGVAAPQIAPLFHLSAGQLGLFFSAGTVGLLFGAGAGGRAADWIGRKPPLIISLALFGLGSLATALSWDFSGLVASRALTGLGVGGALPVVVALVAENTSPRWRSTAVGLTYAGLPIGGVIAGLLSAATEDWKLVFLVGGFAPLLLTPALWLWLPESGEFRSANSIASSAESSANTKPAGIALVLNRTSLFLWASFFFTLLTLYLLANWLPSLLVGHGFSKSGASLVQIAFNLGGVIGSVGLGALMDTRYRSGTAVVTFVGIVLALLWLANIPSAVSVAMVVGGLVGVTLLGAQTVLYGLAPRCYPTSVRGRGVGAAVMVGRIGSIAGPLVAAAMIGSGQGMGVVWRLIPIIVIAALCTVQLVSRTRWEAGDKLADPNGATSLNA